MLDLDRAVELLEHGNLPSRATVITIDDGFYSIYQCALPLLQTFSFPATVYVTTYYCVKDNPVFRLVVQYMFWKTEKQQIDLTGLCMTPSGQVSLRQDKEKNRIMWEIIRYGETQCDEAQRCVLANTLGEHLNVQYGPITQSRFLSLINPREIREMVISGTDIQLHTHRHRFPVDEALATREIVDNKTTLGPLVGKPLRHFCYPSGLSSEIQWPWLTATGINSATTSDPGLNYPETPKLALKRFLDGEHISQIQFEGEMFGYTELLRHARSYLRRLVKGGLTRNRRPPL